MTRSLHMMHDAHFAKSCTERARGRVRVCVREKESFRLGPDTAANETHGPVKKIQDLLPKRDKHVQQYFDPKRTENKNEKRKKCTKTIETAERKRRMTCFA